MANYLHCTVSLTPNIAVCYLPTGGSSIPLWVPGNEILAATHYRHPNAVHSQLWGTTGTVTDHIATPPARRLMFNKYQPFCRIPVGAILGVPAISCRTPMYSCGSKSLVPLLFTFQKMLRTIFVGLFIYPCLLMYVKHISGYTVYMTHTTTVNHQSIIP